ncbi:MAG: hypothetical protein KGM47_10460 [Acidobacteriota bacterium]|nr:hypothetical protein [Acidobacteriota bacterium]
MTIPSLAQFVMRDAYAARSDAPPAPPPASSPQSRKLFKECQKFEALLISNLWNEMEQGIGSDGDSDPGAATMQGFGIQAAATGVAGAGGMGIARMLYQELAPSLLRNGAQPAAGKKSA